MTETYEPKLKINSDFVEQCKRLHHDAAVRYEAGDGLTIDEAEGMSRVSLQPSPRHPTRY